ncbi:hypothetical protein Tco_1058235 [Tanacetum coccineum]|uniref:Uncharacterized protein n=1 Tax=Tanacetum coccineum TaxID=301880 RepID=A0ABQ5H854_9ASTR
MSHHKRIYVTPSHTKKIFGNMKREGKGFSGRVTPLFPTIMVQAQEEMSEGSANSIDPYHTPIITQPSTSQPQKKQKPKKPKRKDTKIPQSSGPSEPIADEAINEEYIPTHSNDPLLNDCSSIGDFKFKVESHEVREERRVKNSHAQKTIQGEEIDDIDKDVEVTLVDETQGRYGDDLLFDTSVLDGEEVLAGQDVVEKEVSTADLVTTAGEVVTTASVEVSAATTTTTTTITEVDLTLAQALTELRSAKPKVVIQDPVQSTTTTTPSTIPKAKSITFRDPGESTTRTTLTPIPSNIKDKGKAKIVEPGKPLKKKEQIGLDEELAFKLQAEEEEQARLAREKAKKVEEANILWDNVQAIIEADRLLAKRLQAREQEELTDEEKARLFVELLEKRKKHFAALRAQEERNKPPTKAQKKSTMSTYLKHMAGYKQSQLKIKSFAEIQKLFDKAMTRVNMFVDMDTELVKESSKKAEAEMAQENDEVAIDVVPLATKPAPIVEFVREELENLWKLVKAKHGNSRPEEGYERVLWGDLKTMFKHHVEDLIWRNLQGKKVLLWRLYDSCGIHFVSCKLIIGMTRVISFLSSSQSNSRINEVFGSILLGRIVGIKRLLDDLRVTAAQLVMLVQKLLLLVLRVNAAGTKLQLLKRLRLLKEFLLSRDG